MNFLQLLEETEIERNLTVLAYSEGYEIIIAQGKKTGKAHYIYRVSDEIYCDYSLLCEVGAPFKPFFNFLLKKNKIKPEIKETETDYFEIFLIK